ncbi:hypothetical protein KAU37_05130 [Candidatus Bipolaricaulota bacterium]|nr:hypothetical protein [Candidatus Bipolaricaulota bacterium]
MVKVRYKEGLAIHPDLESCAGVRKGTGEALKWSSGDTYRNLNCPGVGVSSPNSLFGGPIQSRGKVEERIRQMGCPEPNKPLPQLFVVGVIHGVIIPTTFP